MHQSAPSAVALTDEACASPEQNSIPALTHLQDRAGSRRDRIDGVVRRLEGEAEEEKDGVAPVKMTRPPWSHSISQSALTVTSATTKGFRREVNTMGAVAMSPIGGLRQRSVFGPAVREKYSMHWGRENVDGRFRAVNEEPSGGILSCAGSCDCAFLASRNLYQAIFDFFLRPIPAVVDSDATLRKQGCFNVAVGSE